jgi:hypothetical protein
VGQLVEGFELEKYDKFKVFFKEIATYLALSHTTCET